MSSPTKSYRPPADAAYSYIEEGDDYMARAQKFERSFVEDESFEAEARKGKGRVVRV